MRLHNARLHNAQLAHSGDLLLHDQLPGCFVCSHLARAHASFPTSPSAHASCAERRLHQLLLHLRALRPGSRQGETRFCITLQQIHRLPVFPSPCMPGCLIVLGACLAGLPATLGWVASRGGSSAAPMELAQHSKRGAALASHRGQC